MQDQMEIGGFYITIDFFYELILSKIKEESFIFIGGFNKTVERRTTTQINKKK